jgi:virginiamycin B lyase
MSWLRATRLYLPGLALGLAAVAAAQSVAFSSFAIPTPASNPNYIAAGPDGALWFTELNANQIGRISTAGLLTEYPIPTAKSGPYGIAAGSDGALWFAEFAANRIGRITTAGVIAEYPVPTANGGPLGIVAGSDGALWFAEFSANNVGRIATDGTIAEYPIPTLLSQPLAIAAGPDGALWFVEFGANRIGTITTGGTIAEYPLPAATSSPDYITAGPDGALWYTQAGGGIGQITTTGVVTFYALNLSAPAASAGSVTLGPDGALWFSEYGLPANSGHRIGRFTTAGATTEYTLPSSIAAPYQIASGPDGALWFTAPGANQIGRAAIVSPPPTLSAVTTAADAAIQIVSSNSWVTVWGWNLAPANSGRSWGAQDIVGGKLPRSLDGVSATIDGSAAYVAYISPTQVNLLAPPGLASGLANVVLTNGSLVSASFPVLLQTYSPAFFAFAAPNQKYVAAICALKAGSFDYLAPAGAFGAGVSSRPAQPGETVALFGTGFGPTSPAPPAGQVLTAAYPAATRVTVTIGGLNAAVVWAGLTEAGLNQLNVTVPGLLPNGDAAVVATVGGVQSQPGLFIPVQR